MSEVLHAMSELADLPRDPPKERQRHSARRHIVDYIINNAGCTQKSITEHTDIIAGQVSNVIHDLIKQGLVIAHGAANAGYLYRARLYFFNQPVPPEVQEEEKTVSFNGDDGFIPVTDFCEKYGQNRKNVLRWLLSGELKGKKVYPNKMPHGKWLVDVNSFTGASTTLLPMVEPTVKKRRGPYKKRNHALSAARMKVSASRRSAIARKGGLAAGRNRRKKSGFFSRLFGG